MWLMTLNQRIFKHQSFKLASGHNHVEITHFLDHRRDLWQMFAMEITADTVFQLLGFSNVYYLAMLIEHNIHAGKLR